MKPSIFHDLIKFVDNAFFIKGIDKRTDENGMSHSERVGILAHLHNYSDAAICAAILHDFLEDINPDQAALRNVLQTQFGVTEEFACRVIVLVMQLTDCYTKGNYPSLNREKRKQIEAERYKLISTEAKNIKLLDLMDNLKTAHLLNREFAETYLKEKKQVLINLKEDTDPDPYMTACYYYKRAVNHFVGITK